MNNPGIDLEIWKQLKRKWTELDANGNKIKVEFKLIADPKDPNKILIIDVIQKINDEIVVQTVQRTAGEADTILGIAGLSMEQLVEVLKKMMHQLHQQTGQRDAKLVITMSPSSPASGEINGLVQIDDHDSKSNVEVNYRHYCLLNALRTKMIELVGDSCAQIRAVYSLHELEFYCEY
jgi:hypothetical protein